MSKSMKYRNLSKKKKQNEKEINEAHEEIATASKRESQTKYQKYM